MNIQESGEMYLETIHILSKERPVVRSIDVAEYMGFSKPSVSRAVGKLKTDNLIDVDKDGFITLTKSGLEIAETMYERHIILSKLLMDLGVPEDIATEDACKIEHDLSKVTFEAIKKHISK